MSESQIVTVIVEGGLVQGVYASKDITVMVRDYDIEGGTAEGQTLYTDKNGEEYSLSEWEGTGKPPDY